jgi:hypothetical protein
MSSTVIVPKSKNTLSLMIRPGSKFFPLSAVAGAIGDIEVRPNEVNSATSTATIILVSREKITE